MRSDHLKAVLIYALEHMKTSQISVLDFGDNENDLNFEEQVESMINNVDNITVHGHTALKLLDREHFVALILDSMVLNSSRDSSLGEIKTYFLNQLGILGIDEKLFEEVYKMFKKKWF